MGIRLPRFSSKRLCKKIRRWFSQARLLRNDFYSSLQNHLLNGCNWRFLSYADTYLTHKGSFRPRHKHRTNVGIAGVCALSQAQGDHAALSCTEIIFRTGCGFDLKKGTERSLISPQTGVYHLQWYLYSLLHWGLENATQGERVRQEGKQAPKQVMVMLYENNSYMMAAKLVLQKAPKSAFIILSGILARP